MKNLGGYHPDKDDGWPIGSIWAHEGQKLYDIVKKQKPLLVVEIGAYWGCSTTWIAKALLENILENKKGKLISIDNGSMGVDPWSLVPDTLKKVIEFRKADCFKTKVPEKIDILFEDGSHEPGFTEKALKRFKAKTVIVHDYGHFIVGPVIQEDFKKVLGEPDEVVNVDHQHNCGLAIKYDC
jgi:predicted O-methyltransferase YrrM